MLLKALMNIPSGFWFAGKKRKKESNKKEEKRKKENLRSFKKEKLKFDHISKFTAAKNAMRNIKM